MNLVISSLENTSINRIVARTSDAGISKVQVRRYPNLSSSTVIEKRERTGSHQFFSFTKFYSSNFLRHYTFLFFFINFCDSVQNILSVLIYTKYLPKVARVNFYLEIYPSVFCSLRLNRLDRLNSLLNAFNSPVVMSGIFICTFL